MRNLLIEWGLPAEAIEIAERSRNTYEYALEIHDIRERQPLASALPVTSAAHMPRALAVLLKAGLPVTPAITDVEVVATGAWTILSWLPDTEALARTTRAMKERIGAGPIASVVK